MNEIINNFNTSPAGAAVQSAATTVYTAAISFDGVKTMVLAAAGTLVAVILIIRIVSAYAKKNWGEIITEIAGVVVVLWFVSSPDSAIGTLNTIRQSIFG